MRRWLPERAERFTAIVLLTLGACGDGASTAPPVAPPPVVGPSAVAGAYVHEVVDVMQRGSINRHIIDWPAFRAKVVSAASGAQRIPDTYPAIRVALSLLADDHSLYLTPNGAILSASTKSCFAAPVAPSPPVPPSIGYVRVRGFSGSADEAVLFATRIQDSIRARDVGDLVGWIVDLRGNTGGNMWPMVAGVGPVLGEGVAGYFIDPDGVATVWEYRGGASWLEGSPLQRVAAPYALRREDPRVAVLTDNGVASSGEAVAVSFRQRPGTRSFGSATCGLSTANLAYALSDGARLVLTVAVMADRKRTPYGAALQPDELITTADRVVERAVAWLIDGR